MGILKHVFNLLKAQIRTLLYVIVVLQATNAWGQTTVTDSLKRALGNLDNDTNKAILYNKLAFNFAVDGKNNEAIFYATEAERLSRKLHYVNGFANSYNIKGIVSRNKGENEMALRYYFVTVKLAEFTGSKSMYARANHNMARIYENLGDYSKAMQCLFVSLKVKESIHDKQGMANTLSHLGNIYHIQKDDRALQIYLIALNLERETKNYAGECIILNNLGVYYKDKGAYSVALKYFNRSLAINSKANYLPDVGRSYVNIGEICSLTNQDHEALTYYNKALDIFMKLDDMEAISYVYNCLGKMLMKQKSNLKAREYLEKARYFAYSSDVLKRKRDAHESLSKVYELLDQPQQSLENYKLFIQLRDSIYNVETSKNIIRSELDFEYSKKEAINKVELEKKEIELTSNIQRKQIQLLIAISLLTILLFSAILIIQRVRHKERMKLISLRNKIANDLHDEVGSALSSITMFTNIARMNPNESNDNIIRKIGDTSKITVENMSDIVWSINTRNDLLINLMERMKVYGYALFEDSSVKFTIDFPVDLDKFKIGMESRKNLLFFYKEVLNNIVKHAHATQVMVKLEFQSKMLLFQISDNGQGFNLAQKTNGNGLISLRERALSLNGRIEINSEIGKGTRILLYIPTTSLGR
jgi:signal transduction histidine kinase/Tfp pilus assembly protein PilF